jgi:hypothetical protein
LGSVVVPRIYEWITESIDDLLGCLGEVLDFYDDFGK